VSARVGVITFPGTLDDVDAARAVRLAGAEAVSLWHGDADLKGVDAIVVPGGFSYGDYLRCGAIAKFACPYGSSDDADENPTHVRRMFVGSWGYFGQPNYWREGYGYTGDWRVKEVELRLSEDQYARYAIAGHEAFMYFLNTFRNVVSEQVATLECVKPARDADRDLQEPIPVRVSVMVPRKDEWINEIYGVEEYAKMKEQT
jgi:hypothetical protein